MNTPFSEATIILQQWKKISNKIGLVINSEKEAVNCQYWRHPCFISHSRSEIQWHNVGQIPSQQENITDRRLEKSEQKGWDTYTYSASSITQIYEPSNRTTATPRHTKDTQYSSPQRMLLNYMMRVFLVYSRFNEGKLTILQVQTILGIYYGNQLSIHVNVLF